MSKKHMGSSIDDFLKSEGIFEEAQAQAVKEVVAWQLADAMKKKKLSKNRMATRLKTSRTPGRSAARRQRRHHAFQPATRGGIVGHRVRSSWFSRAVHASHFASRQVSPFQRTSKPLRSVVK